MRKDKGSSEVRSCKTRSKALSVETDVNKLTTSKETEISFSDIVKILNIINKFFGVTNTIAIYKQKNTTIETLINCM